MTTEEIDIIKKVIDILSVHSYDEEYYLEAALKAEEGDCSLITDSAAFDHSQCIYLLKNLLEK